MNRARFIERLPQSNQLSPLGFLSMLSLSLTFRSQRDHESTTMECETAEDGHVDATLVDWFL
jgi:hypothetical protein